MLPDVERGGAPGVTKFENGSRIDAEPRPAWEPKIGVAAERPCARDASICRILQGDGDEVSNT